LYVLIHVIETTLNSNQPCS